jgi:hypothetical protein
MKKTWIIVITILVVGILMFSLTACAIVETESNSNAGTSMFVQVEETSYWRVVYHKDTKVMYTVSVGGYNGGNFTLLVNADGTPMLWEDTE